MLLYMAHFPRPKGSHADGRLYIGLNPLQVVARKQSSTIASFKIIMIVYLYYQIIKPINLVEYT